MLKTKLEGSPLVGERKEGLGVRRPLVPSLQLPQSWPSPLHFTHTHTHIPRLQEPGQLPPGEASSHRLCVRHPIIGTQNPTLQFGGTSGPWHHPHSEMLGQAHPSWASLSRSGQQRGQPPWSRLRRLPDKRAKGSHHKQNGPASPHLCHLPHLLPGPSSSRGSRTLLHFPDGGEGPIQEWPDYVVHPSFTSDTAPFKLRAQTHGGAR